MTRRWCLVLFSVLLGCAPARPPVTLPDTSIEDADALVREGCYDCLVDARARYRAFASDRRWPTVVRRLFEVELLIAMRERELGLDPTAALSAASALGDELPATMESSRYLAAVESLPHERHGWPRSELAAFRRAHPMTAAKASEEAAWIRQGPLTGPIAEYLARSLECAHVPSRPSVPATGSSTVTSTAAPGPDAVPPIVRYRLGTCGVPNRPSLEALRTAVPRFVETSFFLGQLAVSAIAEGNAGDPHTLVAEALQRMPQSPAATFLGASLQHAVADWDRAIELYSRTLALKPVHEDAWLGRTIGLTELGRNGEAIDAATRMIGLRMDNVDQAFYWRAWNQHARGDLTAARADIEDARRMRRSEEILTMAGIIAHDQDDLEPAARDLTEARRMGQGRNCRADWYLGSVLFKQRQWAAAAPIFEAAMTCYALDVKAREFAIRTLEEKTGIDPSFKQSRIARLQMEIQVQRRQRMAAAFNAANSYALSGDLEKPPPLIDVAAGDPDLGDEIEELRRHMAAVAAARRGSRLMTQ